MGRSMKRQLKKTQQLGQMALGLKGKPTKRFADALAAVGTATEVVVEIPWYPDGGYHQIMLQKRVGDRVYFINTAGDRNATPGTDLEGTLARRVEEEGLESALISDLQTLFESGKGTALIF